MGKVELLWHARIRLAETPAGALEAELLARDAELERLREQIRRLNADLDAAQFRNREHDKRVASTKPRPPTPFD
jgi:septal ring factor EnvC (AmiA/AmiB activator)